MAVAIDGLLRSELSKVDALVRVLDGTEPIGGHTRRRRWCKHLRRSVERMVDEGMSYGRASDGPEFLQEQDEATFRRFIRDTNQDMGWQCDTVDEAFARYVRTGEIPAPHYPLRIAILLRKAKEPERERRFLAAWCRHFETGPGAKYSKLSERARKTGAID